MKVNLLIAAGASLFLLGFGAFLYGRSALTHFGRVSVLGAMVYTQDLVAYGLVIAAVGLGCAVFGMLAKRSNA